jgi:hypothetical protein
LAFGMLSSEALESMAPRCDSSHFQSLLSNPGFEDSAPATHSFLAASDSVVLQGKLIILSERMADPILREQDAVEIGVTVEAYA